jgi:glyoxylase-like metal-dependent hydrolase (beta-lactamase superfamily II)
MIEIVPGVFTWSWFSERFQYDFHGTFVPHPSGNVCIDPVETSDAVLDELARLGVARIVLTNRNHTRACNKVRARTGAKVAIHPADQGFARQSNGAEIDEELAIGQTVGPFTVLAAAGKSPGEVALYWKERRILVVGDACVGNPPGKLGLLPEKVMDDPSALRRSLRRLATEVDFDVLLVGDGVPILRGAREALAALVTSFDQ